MSEVNSWSGTAASNNSAAPNGWPENMAFADVNNTGREVMAAVKRWRDDVNGSLTAGGSSGAFTLTPNRTISAYATGLEFIFKANHTSAAVTPTLNVSAVGAASMQTPDGSACNLISGRYYTAIYISSVWVVIDSYPETTTAQEWQKTQYYDVNTSTASSLTVDALADPILRWTLSANGTLNDFTTITDGATGKLIIVQGGSGSYTVSVNANIKGSWPTLSTAVGSVDEIYWSCSNGTNISIVGYSLDVAS